MSLIWMMWMLGFKMCGLLAAFGCRLSAVRWRLAAVGCPLTAHGSPLSAV